MRKPYDGNLTITSEYGNRRFQLSDGSWYSDFHNGIDIGGIFPVLAAQGGTVVALATNGIDRGGALVAGTPANWIKIDHGNGLQTWYWHLSKVDVALGQRIEEGQQIGVSGRTGEATGFHLHFMVVVNGGYRNPRDFVNFAIEYPKYNNSNVNNTNMKQERRVYTVVSGDYLEGIALKLYGDKNRVNDLVTWNSIANKNLIYVGQQIVYYVDVAVAAPVAEPQPNIDKVKADLKAQYDKEKSDLEVSYQKKIEELNAEDAKERDKLLKEYTDLDEQYKKGELNSRSEIARLETRIQELTDQIKARQEVKLELAGLDIEDMGIHILQEAVEAKGFIAKWQARVDTWFPGDDKFSGSMRSLLKYDWAWILYTISGFFLSAFVALQAVLNPEQKILVVIIGVVVGIFGFIVKFLFSYADTNKDGKIDLNDTVILKEYQATGRTVITTEENS